MGLSELTTEQAARLLHCSQQHVRRLATRGELAYVDTPGGRRFPLEGVAERALYPPARGRPKRSRETPSASPSLAPQAGSDVMGPRLADDHGAPLRSAPSDGPQTVRRVRVKYACSVVVDGRVIPLEAGEVDAPVKVAERLLAAGQAVLVDE